MSNNFCKVRWEHFVSISVVMIQWDVFTKEQVYMIGNFSTCVPDVHSGTVCNS